MSDDENAVVRELKNAAMTLGLLVAIPVMIPLAAAAVTYGVIKDKFIKCPQCGSRKVELQGSSPRRQSPVYSFYLCRDCGCRSKKLFGDPLEKASEEEFAQLIPPTPQ